MRRFSNEKIELIKDLRKKGQGFKSVAKKLSCSSASVYKYSNKVKLSKEAQNFMCQNVLRRKRIFSSKYAKEKEITVPSLSPELASVLGHLFFDGSVCYTNGKYMLSYCNSSIELLKGFISKTKKLFSLKGGKISKFKGVNLDWYQTTFYSKKAFQFVKRFSPEFSTSKNIGVPVEIMNAENKTKGSFLQAFWADEGSIDYRGRLLGSSKSIKMIYDLVEMHKGFGINCKERLNKNNRAHSIVVKRNASNYLKFYKKIGFGKAIVKAGYNLGKYKQEVLAAHLHKMASF